ncbi:MAG: hypothetical protein KTR28_03950 [Micavibrio sp.]|nr:hypothetical protein [Micavibrio sp.]
MNIDEDSIVTQLLGFFEIYSIKDYFTGDAASWVVAIVTFIGVCIAYKIGNNASKIASYQALQHDRKFIEEIYHLYCDAIREFAPSASFSMPVYMGVIRKLHMALDLASLYGLSNIEEYISERKDLFVEGAKSYGKCYDDTGQPRNSHNHNDVEKYHEISKKLLCEYFENKHMDVFRQYLKINTTKK